jgi:prepilin peptidase CpaA
MPHPFFPDPVFGWTFYGVLVGLTTVAAITDLRRTIVPKWLTLTTLALGVIFNVVRGVLLGSAGQSLWVFSGHNAWLGGIDGLLLSLAGFGVGFGLFFLMWILRTCGGGDVKLMAALGSWIGPMLVLLVMVGSALVLFVLAVFRLLWGGFAPSAVQKRIKALPLAANRAAAKGQRRQPLRMTFSLPVAVATTLLLLWFYRVDLHLAPPSDPAKVQAHAH